MKKYLLPLQQLEALNFELNDIANTLTSPVIIVGGQSVSYWYTFYESSIPDFDLAPLASVDIDYIAQKIDINAIATKWNVDIEMASVDDAPPSVAVAILNDRSTHEIKIFDGQYFLDVDELIEGISMPNIVDFIDAPAGFQIEDVKLDHIRKYLTVPYEFSASFDIAPNSNILILNPIGCLKSRFANMLHTNKPKTIELLRIESLKYPIIYFFQDLHEDGDFRNVRRHIAVLSEILLSETAIQLLTGFDVDFRNVFNHIVTTASGGQTYHEKDAPILIGKLNDRYEKRLKSHMAFINRNNK
ncbi:hypothetical protein HNW13_018580 [Shewanella sp. BF02_Schw]|uniref:hypothetical protein n=1 Tax=Shewanella sp. BF02_Schw TaxID=394908 RepID=UPI001782A9F8|nr:hypothetical protein [Shewanella sp. BF02_Schw]MBO1897748.1 hypothetical protein [Shewanella sp. BF02_Schw]